MYCFGLLRFESFNYCSSLFSNELIKRHMKEDDVTTVKLQRQPVYLEPRIDCWGTKGGEGIIARQGETGLKKNKVGIIILHRIQLTHIRQS